MLVPLRCKVAEGRGALAPDSSTVSSPQRTGIAIPNIRLRLAAIDTTIGARKEPLGRTRAIRSGNNGDGHAVAHVQRKIVDTLRVCPKVNDRDVDVGHLVVAQREADAVRHGATFLSVSPDSAAMGLRSANHLNAILCPRTV